VPDYFLSDVHLRHDRPDRGHRLSRLVDGLKPDDRLFIVGDLCDFWLTSRQRRRSPLDCPGMSSLREFVRKGGKLELFAGNHDGWLREYYQRSIGGEWVEDSRRIVSYGRRLHLAHGHRIGARTAFKAILESRTFLLGFELLPSALAESLERRLEGSNEKHREANEQRHIAVYRNFADTLAGEVDLVVLGHLHKVVDDTSSEPRLIVLGNWHRRASYLKIDESGMTLHIVDDPTSGAPVSSFPPAFAPPPLQYLYLLVSIVLLQFRT
jgi:UDP-2,3-diacylglucosamine hydrolase